MFEGVGAPGNQDQKTNQNGSDGISVPFDAISQNRHHQTERIDGDVVSVVNEEHMDCRVSAVQETVDA
jgi:hypothetical protein